MCGAEWRAEYVRACVARVCFCSALYTAHTRVLHMHMHMPRAACVSVCVCDATDTRTRTRALARSPVRATVCGAAGRA